MSKFEIKFEADKDGNYYTIMKSEHSGFILTKWTKSKKEDAKKSHSQHNWYYPNFKQIAERVVWLNLSGHNIEDMLVSYNQMIERLTATLESAK